MRRATVLTLRHGATRWSTWVAGAGLLADSVMVASAKGGAFTATTAVVGFAHAYVMIVVGVVLGGHLHTHLVRTGSRLTPGLHGLQLRTTAWLAAIAAAIPLVLATALRGDAQVLAAVTPLSMALGLLLGSITSTQTKGAALGLIAGMLGIGNGALIGMARATEGGTTPAWVTLLGQPTPATIAIGSGIVAIALLLWQLHRLDESSLWYRLRRSSRETSCDESGGDEWLLRLVPPIGRRTIPRRDRAIDASLWNHVAQFRRTSGATSPFGLALIMTFFSVILILGIADEDDLLGEPMFPGLFVFNGLISIGMQYTWRRLRVEGLRPIARHELIDAMGLALALDFVVYGAWMLMAHVATFGLLQPDVLSRAEFWGGLSIVAGGMAVATSTTLLAQRWTRWGGAFGFFVGFVGSAFVTESLRTRARAPEPIEWIAWSAGFTLLGLLLLPFARRVWSRAEFGRA